MFENLDKLTIRPYIDFTNSTAAYPQKHTKYYILLGLIGELGELVEKSGIHSPLIFNFVRFAKVCEIQKKLLRDGYNEEKVTLARKLLKDIMLDCAGIFDYVKQSMETDGFIFDENEPHALLDLEFGDLFWYIAQALDKFKFYDIGSILYKNFLKLTSRKIRNVIQGSGDER